MKLKPEKLKIGQKYFLIDYNKDVVVEGLFYNHDLYKSEESYDFRHSMSIDEDGDANEEAIHLDLIDGVLKEHIGDGEYNCRIENPVFLTKEEAEANKNKYILNCLKEVRKLILKELKDNSESIKKIKGK